jgi:hypothetical protein
MRDLTYAIRLLTRSPGFAAVTVLSLIISIGSTALFSVVDAVLLRMLPVFLCLVTRLCHVATPANPDYRLTLVVDRWGVLREFFFGSQDYEVFERRVQLYLD